MHQNSSAYAKFLSQSSSTSHCERSLASCILERYASEIALLVRRCSPGSPRFRSCVNIGSGLSCLSGAVSALSCVRYSFLDFLVGAFKRRLVGAATFVFFHASTHSSTTFCRMTLLATDASLHCLPEPRAVSLPSLSLPWLVYLLPHSLECLHGRRSSGSTPLCLGRVGSLGSSRSQ